MPSPTTAPPSALLAPLRLPDRLSAPDALCGVSAARGIDGDGGNRLADDSVASPACGDTAKDMDDVTSTADGVATGDAVAGMTSSDGSVRGSVDADAPDRRGRRMRTVSPLVDRAAIGTTGAVVEPAGDGMGNTPTGTPPLALDSTAAAAPTGDDDTADGHSAGEPMPWLVTGVMAVAPGVPAC